ncbi:MULTISPECIES: hypothetical protein [unclassified Parabacteroides]|uniref:hypothetical protein n=2 Tax=unclassified Parabacteroides TaxID=2649774 RepID=UPI0024769694|nr:MULTISPECIES: hypothetical protein [unclassified Parabacteroides]
MLPKLHYYNPGHETDILQGSAHYTPSGNVQKMRQELALLPAWYADEGDYIFVEENTSPRFFSQYPEEVRPKVTILSREDIKKKAASLPRMEAAPWGITPQSIPLFEDLRDTYGLNIEVPAWKEEFTRLTSRQTAALCFQQIKERLPNISFPPPPLFFKELEEIEAWLNTHEGAFVIKTPFSSSGRGLLWLDNNCLKEKDKKWISGALKKQGSVGIEYALPKDQDMALEYYSDGEGNLRYEGISVFGTSKVGAYKGNNINEQAEYEEINHREIGTETYRQIQEAVTHVIQENYARHYKGYLGVDMLMYRTGKDSHALHPCLEINMRYTMGLAAIRLVEKYIHPDASGTFNIHYEVTPYRMNEWHKLMKQAYPCKLKEGKLRSGYYSLTPVTGKTHYTAYLVIM